MTVLLRDKQVLRATADLLNGALEDKDRTPKRTRILLSAFMMAKHSATISSVPTDRIEPAALKLIESISSFTTGTIDGDQFADAFVEYEAAFEVWQQADLQALKGTLQAELSSVEGLRSMVGSDPEWAPHLQAFQQQVEQSLKSLPQVKQTNAQIAHDLFLDGAEYQVLGLDEEIVITDEPDFLRRARKGLLGLVEENKETYKLIEETLDLSIFDYPNQIRFILDMMAELCAPIRDEQIQTLKQKSSSVEPKMVLGALRDMAKDLIQFNLAKAFPNLPSIIVQYERDAFVCEFRTVENAKRLMKRIYIGDGFTSKDLAMEMLRMSLARDYQVEMFYMDKARLTNWRLKIEDIAKGAAEEMLGKAVGDNDPTTTLLKERIIQGLVSHDLSKLKMADQLTELQARIDNLMEHHIKVYEPVYTSLLQS